MRKEYDFSKGRRGPVLVSTGKTRITIMLDDDVIEYFRARAEAQGTGYQTMINSALRAAIETSGRKPADERRQARLSRVLILGIGLFAIAIALPVQAKPPSSRGLWLLRSATAPTTGSTNAERIVAAVTM